MKRYTTSKTRALPRGCWTLLWPLRDLKARWVYFFDWSTPKGLLDTYRTPKDPKEMQCTLSNWSTPRGLLNTCVTLRNLKKMWWDCVDVCTLAYTKYYAMLKSSNLGCWTKFFFSISWCNQLTRYSLREELANLVLDQIWK